MRYLPKSPAERQQMLAAIGAASIDDLFSIIPAEYRLDARSRRAAAAGGERDHRLLPRGRAEERDRLRQLSGRGLLSALPAVIIDSLVQRGEFLTSYTPYQAEITQGTLQAIFEFQTMIAELTGHGRGQRQHV